MVSREEFLAAVEELHPAKFLHFMEAHNSKNDSFDVMELLETLAHDQHDRLWNGLKRISQDCLTKFLPGECADDMETEEEAEDNALILECLNDVATVGLCAISLDKPVMNSAFLETAIMLHGILLSVPEEKLQNNIAVLCETWFINEHDGKDELVTHTLPYLLIKSLSQPSVVSVRRVWAMRQGLLILDYEDECSSSLKMILLQCMVHQSFIGNEEGCRFLSFTFGLHPDFIDELHKTIKDSIPFCPMSALSSYGEVYLRAWRVASGPYLEKLENSCIQDLMYRAVHAQRSGPQSMAIRLKKLLSYFHHQKKQNGVDQLLLRLYQPILWRSFNVPNAHVRANAAALLMDVFPLQDPQAGHEEEDALMQKQFDVLEALLSDPSPVVRAYAVLGVCKIAHIFWELIPSQVLKTLIGKIVEDLAFDVSSSAVRLAAFQGLKHLLDNRLSNALLKVLLPSLSNMIHDQSEKVRIAFLEILLLVKSMKTIKFWNIVPLEHLLARLEVDTSSHVIRRLIKLLLNSFHDSTKGVDMQLDGCITLWKANPGAARKFYQYLHLHIPIQTSVKFMNFLQRCLRVCIKKQGAGNGVSQNGSSYDESYLQKGGNETTMMPEAEEQELSLDDDEAMAGLLETIAILWMSLKEQLDKPSNKHLKAKMIDKFTRAVPEFFITFQDGRCHTAALLIASHLPASSVPRFSGSCFSSVSTMSPSTPSSVYGPALDCLCSWGKSADVLKLITDWIETGLNRTRTNNNTAASNGKNQKSRGRRKETAGISTDKNQPHLGLDFLSWIMVHPPCKDSVLQLTDDISKLLEALHLAMDTIEENLSQSSKCSSSTNDFLVKSLQSYIHLKIHLQYNSQITADDNDDIGQPNEAVEAFEHVISWADRVVLPSLDDISTNNPSSKQQSAKVGSKRCQDISQVGAIEETLQCKVVQALLETASEMMMMGFGDLTFSSHLAEFTSPLVQYAGVSLRFIPGIAKLMYQIMQKNAVTKAVDESFAADPVTTILGNILRCTSCLTSEEDTKLQVLMNIKPILTEVVKMYHYKQTTHDAPQSVVMATIIAVIVAELTELHKESDNLPVGESILDLPPTSAIVLSVICKTKSILRSFVNEILNCLDAQALTDSLGYIATLQLIATLVASNNVVDEMLPCVQLVKQYLETIPDTQELRHSVEAKILARETLDKLSNN